MPYNRHSPEALIGHWCEWTIAQRAIANGWHVLHTSEVGSGATMVTGPDGGKVIMPDLQLLDLLKGRATRFVEVKFKTGAYCYQILQIDCTGIDLPKWEAYCRISDSGVPVDLALVHLRWPLRSSLEIAPKLLWQTVNELRQRRPMPNTDRGAFPRGGVVWDINDFELLGDIPPPPPEILEMWQQKHHNMRVWEKPAKPLRRPRVVPGQLELFQ